MTKEIIPPSPDFHEQYKAHSLEECITKFGGTPLQEAAKQAAEKFEKVRPKMDLYRELRGFTWKLR